MDEKMYMLMAVSWNLQSIRIIIILKDLDTKL